MLWPLILLAIKPVYNYLANLFNWNKMEESKQVCTASGCCSSSEKVKESDEKPDEPKLSLEVNYVHLAEGQSLES